MSRPLPKPSPFDPWRRQKLARDPHVLPCTLRSLANFFLALNQNSWFRKRPNIRNFVGCLAILLLMDPSIGAHQTHSQQAQSHQAGQSFAASKVGSVMEMAKSTNPHTVPGFQTDKPKEAFLNAETLGDAALAASKTDDAAQYLHAQAQKRETFKIDPDTDPLFVDAKAAVLDPQKTLKEEITPIPASEGSEELKTCEESGEEYSQSCSRHLEIVLKITPATTQSVPHCPGHKERKGWSLHYSHWTCSGCTTQQITIPKKVEVERERWIDGCAVLEDLAEKGLCRYETQTTSPLNETRTIQGEPVTRERFEEHCAYTCFKVPPASNTCKVLRDQGCYQVKSTCKERVGDACVIWRQTYSCPSNKKSPQSYRAAGKDSPFCLTGNCTDASYEANTEMMNAMGHLYALREIQDNLREFNVIFKGTHRWCTRNLWNFRDCCGGTGAPGKGWGVSLHLSSCDAAEIELRTLRDKNLCVLVGTYCAEKNLGRCTRKKTSFCCYGSKIARLIQQSGRAQLGIGWGTPQHPTCERGFSPEELSRINFSNIDFSELFADIQSKTVVKDQGQSLGMLSTKRLQENMTVLTKPSSDPDTNQQRQALKEKGF